MNDTPSAESLFLAAAEIAQPQERTAFLARECGGDLALRERVEGLLASHEEAGDFLEPSAPSPEMEAEFARLKPEEAGERIGHLQVARADRRGWLRQWSGWRSRSEPVRRRVALKIIKLGMDTQRGRSRASSRSGRRSR